MFKRFLVVFVATLLAFGGDSYAGNTYSSGSKSSSSSSRSSSSSSKSYSSGSRSSSSSPSRSSGSKSYSSGSSSSSSKPSYSSGSKSYSSGSSSKAKSSTSTPNGSWFSKPKVTTPTLDSKAGSSLKYAQAQQPLPQPQKTLATPETVKPTYKLSDPQTRETKRRSFYSDYQSRPAPAQTVVYQDNFSPFFWMWMMDRSADDRAKWAYNHKNDMDPTRLAELKAKDAELDAKLKALEAQGAAADPNYKPEGLDDDLVYDKAAEPEKPASKPFPWGRFFGWTFGLAALGGAAYLIFFRKWKHA